jgi:hypothetical protein
VKTVVCVPRKPDDRRDQIWAWVRNWLQTHHDWPIFEGYDQTDRDEWSLSAARNNAAQKATAAIPDWDVAIHYDGDFIVHPDALRYTAEQAHGHNQMIVAGDVCLRMDKRSSDAILAGGQWFPRPDGYLPKTGTNESVFGEPSSGVWAVNRSLWEATGGMCETLCGWGWEDLVFISQCVVAGDGIAWTPDSVMLHLWHERAEQTENTELNHNVYRAFEALTWFPDHELAREYLRTLGHPW